MEFWSQSHEEIQKAFDIDVQILGFSNNHLYIPSPLTDEYIDLNPGDGPPKFKNLEQEQLMEPDVPLADALEILVEHPFVLIDYRDRFQQRDREEGFNGEMRMGRASSLEDLMYVSDNPFKIVTIADVNKRYTRLMFYELLTLLEMQLAEIVKEKYPYSGDLLEQVSDDETRRWEREQRENMFVHIVEYMNLRTLFKTIKLNKNLYEKLGFQSARKFKSYVNPINEFRNRVMHPVRSIALSREEYAERMKAFERTRELVDRI